MKLSKQFFVIVVFINSLIFTYSSYSQNPTGAEWRAVILKKGPDTLRFSIQVRSKNGNIATLNSFTFRIRWTPDDFANIKSAPNNVAITDVNNVFGKLGYSISRNKLKDANTNDSLYLCLVTGAVNPENYSTPEELIENGDPNIGFDLTSDFKEVFQVNWIVLNPNSTPTFTIDDGTYNATAYYNNYRNAPNDGATSITGGTSNIDPGEITLGNPLLGEFWINKSFPANLKLRGATFLGNNITFVVGSGGNIWKTTNDGNSWDSIYSTTNQTLNDIAFSSNGLFGLCVGNNGTILRTEDGGNKWTKISQSIASNSLYDVEFDPTNPSVALICGWGYIIKTSDGGISWINTKAKIPDYKVSDFYEIRFVNKDTVITSAASGVIEQSTNGGSSWKVIKENGDADGENLNCLDVIPGTNKLIAGAYHFIQSTNSGSSWTNLMEANSYYYDLEFANDQIGIAVGLYGYIMRTTNAGNNWDSVYSYPGADTLGASLIGLAISPNGEKAIAVGYTGYRDSKPLILYSFNLIESVSNRSISFTENLHSIPPKHFTLQQNYPNPFNPVTNISFILSIESKVNLKIFDISGKEIEILINNEVRPAGKYSIEFNGNNLSSGIYFYKLETEKFSEVKRMVLYK